MATSGVTQLGSTSGSSSTILTGAYELEGAFDPDVVLRGALKTWSGTDASAAEIVAPWRYRLDAASASAGDTRLVVGILADDGEALTLRLNNSTLNVETGIAADADAVVEADRVVGMQKPLTSKSRKPTSFAKSVASPLKMGTPALPPPGAGYGWSG